MAKKYSSNKDVLTFWAVAQLSRGMQKNCLLDI